MPALTSMTLSELQDHVATQERIRGFSEESVLDKCLMLGEEVGELFKAVRQEVGLGIAQESRSYDAASELADVLNFIFAIAIRLNVDLGVAFAEKEAINTARTWHPRP